MEKGPAKQPPRAVLFDAYGTLFDVYSVALTAEQLFPGSGNALAQLWRDKQIDYTRLVSMSGPRHYQPFWTITRNALKFSADKLGLAQTAEGEERLLVYVRGFYSVFVRHLECIGHEFVKICP